MATNDIDTKIETAFRAGAFEPFIREIEFPLFKNLQPGLKIEFTHPITALIGQNGANKSSILRALQACPDGVSISSYWFDTELDEIDCSKGAQRYIHRYIAPSGAQAEVQKSRVQKNIRGKDYFETTRPRKRDGMSEMPPYDKADEDVRSQTRWKPIVKNVSYLDFRALLPAYDILMSFDWRAELRTIDEKKQLVRQQSHRVKRMLDGNTQDFFLYKKNRQIKPTEKLSKNEVDEISRILGREYTSIKLVEHDLYGCIGWTAILKTNALQYSEAYAGSGEYAVTMLVRAIEKAPDFSLVLLDEPETSLHPGAQFALLEYMKKRALAKKLQIVISTHSRDIVEGLPPAARKLLAVNSSSGKVELLSQNANLVESFERLGTHYSDKMILVEDRLAGELIKRWLREKGTDAINGYSIQIVPGGANRILNRVIPVQCELNSDCVVVLDGDMRPDSPINFALTGENAIKELERMKIKSKDLLIDGGDSDNQQQKEQSATMLLTWLSGHLAYLPGTSNPENLLLSIIGEEECKKPSDAKERWVKKTVQFTGMLEEEKERVSSEQILSCQISNLANEAQRSSERYLSFIEYLDDNLLPKLSI